MTTTLNICQQHQCPIIVHLKQLNGVSLFYTALLILHFSRSLYFSLSLSLSLSLFLSLSLTTRWSCSSLFSLFLSDAESLSIVNKKRLIFPFFCPLWTNAWINDGDHAHHHASFVAEFEVCASVKILSEWIPKLSDFKGILISIYFFLIFTNLQIWTNLFNCFRNWSWFELSYEC